MDPARGKALLIVEVINPRFRLCKQVILVRRKTLPSALFIHANGGHRFPGCGQPGEPPGDGERVKFVTEQIWPPESGRHLNPHLISNVKYTLSPLLAFLNKWPPDTQGGKGGGGQDGCVCVCVQNLAFISINLSFFNSLLPSEEECSHDRALDTINYRPLTHIKDEFRISFLAEKKS